MSHETGKESEPPRTPTVGSPTNTLSYTTTVCMQRPACLQIHADSMTVSSVSVIL